MSDREDYVRHLLAEHRESLAKAEATEAAYTAVHEEYREKAAPVRIGEITARLIADADPRVVKAVGDGAYYHRRAHVYALAYQVERDVDDRKARR